MTRTASIEATAGTGDLAPLVVPEEGTPAAYAASLLARLGIPVVRAGPAEQPIRGAAAEWAHSGAMSLTGFADGPPLAAPAAVASCARGAALALARLAAARTPGSCPLHAVEGPALLGERAALTRPPLGRAGRATAGGGGRLLRTADGWIALNLGREDDVALLPAWLESDPRDDPWTLAEAAVRGRASAPLIERARLMGLPAARLPAATERAAPSDWVRVAAEGERRAQPGPPLVVDLSSLWAGPLCAQLLGACGSRVIKVESVSRPDGARGGPDAFFDLMNGAKEQVALDLCTPRGREQLQRLVSRADIVVESSRPRALAQLGIDAAALVRATPGLTWISITGYGRREPEAGWVAFGDDAAVAAGLVSLAPDGTPVFCADAVADPLTGLHAAVAALASLETGGGRLLDVALCNVASSVLCERPTDESGTQESRGGPVLPPRARPRRRRAAPFGADTARVLGEFGIPC